MKKKAFPKEGSFLEGIWENVRLSQRYYSSTTTSTVQLLLVLRV